MSLHDQTKHGQKYSFGATTLFKYTSRNYCQKAFLKTLGPKVKDQVPHMTIYGHKLHFWIHNSTQMYQVATFVNGKYLLGQCLSISENLRVKSEDHQMTKYGLKCSFGTICTCITLFSCFR